MTRILFVIVAYVVILASVHGYRLGREEDVEENPQRSSASRSYEEAYGGVIDSVLGMPLPDLMLRDDLVSIHPPPPPSNGFQWHHEEFSECSVTCGDGEEFAEVTCRNRKTGTRVLDVYCEAETKKPERIVRPCAQGKCEAVWVAGEWSPCSAVCGGGLTRRTLYCAEEVDLGTFQRTLDRLCRGERPESEKRCNVGDCPQWYAGQWSQCSRSCGTGTQERAVVCRGTETLDCIDEMKPVTERICHQKPCGLRTDSSGKRDRQQQGSEMSPLKSRNISAIEEYNYRYQRRGHETAVDMLVDASGRKMDYPVIREAFPLPLPSTTASDDKASDDNSGSGEDAEPMSTALKFDTFATFPETTREEYSSVDDSDDSGQRRLLPPVSKEGDVELDQYSVLQLKPRSELTLAAAQKSLTVILLPGTNLRIYCRSNTGHTNSVWMRNADTISRNTLFIRNVSQEHTGIYVCLRGNQMSKVTVAMRSLDQIQKEKLARQNVTTDAQKIRQLQVVNKLASTLTSMKLLLNGIIAPSYAMLEVIPLQYVVTSNWSQCQCGAWQAIQTRKVSCELVTDMLALEVHPMHCSRRKLKAIMTKKNCASSCYNWVVGPWKQCSWELCLSQGVGTKWRLVECSMLNGTLVEESRCKSLQNDRPNNMESCSNDLCQPTWVPMPWSQCSVSCGGKGVKTREVRCVWPASQNIISDRICSPEDKPPAQKFCFNPPCFHSNCRDESLYCSNVPIFQLCNLAQYSRKCCYSCHKTLHYNQPPSETLPPFQIRLSR